MNKETYELALKGIQSGIYKKNIHYLFPGPASVDEFEVVKTLGGSSGQSAWMIQKIYQKYGVQMHVSKNVSDDLLATDFSEACSVSDVIFPAPAVEVYFEDPLLPTILVMKATPEQIQRWFSQLDVKLISNEYISVLMQEGSNVETGKLLSLQLTPNMYDAFLTAGQTKEMVMGILSTKLSDLDNATMAYMLHLVLKVFVFSSIPIYKPVSITRKEMKFGGKPGIKSRPERPAVRVIYLPHIIKENQKKTVTSSKLLHEFRGRRGHIRWYQSERFVNKKGTWDFIPPIADPKTGKYPVSSILKVRKP